MHDKQRANGLGLVPAAFLVHNAEEAATLPAMLPLAEEKLRSVLGAGWSLPSIHEYWAMLALLTLAVFVLWLMALRWGALAYALIVFQAVMAFNVVTHLGGAVALEGYAPGVATAILVEAVVSVVVYRRMRLAGWMSRRQWAALPFLGVVLGGPGLLVLVLRG